MRDERRALDQIAWRVAANRKLGKQNQASPGSLSLMGEVNDLGCVAGEVSDRGIDLSQRYLHSSSVKRREQHAKSSWSSAGILPAVVRASRPHASTCQFGTALWLPGSGLAGRGVGAGPLAGLPPGGVGP